MPEKITKNNKSEIGLQATLDSNNKSKKVNVEVISQGARKPKDELVTGTFRNLESPGKNIKFSFTDDKFPAKFYELKHNEEATIPRKVADHLNRCSYTDTQAVLDSNGNPIGNEEVIVQRFWFSNMNY
jgi:hypothetical protein